MIVFFFMDLTCQVFSIIFLYTQLIISLKMKTTYCCRFFQCRNAVLSGAHPVTLNEALEFAGVQGQVEYQDFTDSKRSVDIRTFLPRNLNGGKKLDKRQLMDYQGRIQVEWQAQHGLSELDAKDLYIRMAQSLKTYGITFFLVKEKKKGQNKMIPRLFGVTKSAILRLDEKTKEVGYSSFILHQLFCLHA